MAGPTVSGFLAAAALAAVLAPAAAQDPGRGAPPAPVGSPAAAASPAVSPRNASYSIDATLEPARRRIAGREVITWRNTSPIPTSEVRLHLYWNAWRNTQSTWLRGAALAAPQRLSLLRYLRDTEWGWTTVTAVRLLGAGAAPPIDVGAGRAFLAPDDGNAEDRTLLQVRLPAPVGPGETINLEVEWTAQVPRPFARTGGIGRYFFLAQWFPKVGVLAPGGWNAHQFHVGTEFFADYGVYDVRLRVPAGWVVGATGREQARRDNGDGTVTHRYVQADVHDFAWTTSPDYLERRERFAHEGLPAVDMRLLLQPEHAAQAARYFEATRAALRHYGEWFGAYPYGHVTIVDPAWQSGAGGMEYPTLFTGGTRWLAPAGVTQPEGVTVHEAGHQFWYGLAGNDEVAHAWLDEGLNTFSTARVVETAFTPHYHAERFFGGFVPWVYRDIALSRDTAGNGLWGYRAAAETDVPATPSWQYHPATGSAITYSKTALWLHTLERYLGWPVLRKALALHFDRSRFGHPAPEDFFRAVKDAAGRDLTWFFDEVYRSADEFDYGIERLTSDPVRTLGFVEGAGGALQEAPPPGAAGPLAHRTTVVVRRYGEATFPVDVEVRFEDGTAVRERWDGRDRWRAWHFERPARARAAVVDPDRVLLLDVRPANNSASLAPAAPAAARKWSLAWLVWLQDLLLTYGFFA
jgi:hypothetical protein